MGKKWRWFTIMIVPHSEESTFSIRLPLAAVQVAVALFIIATVGLLNFANTYRLRLSEAREARLLREANRVQQEEIDEYEAQTTVLKEQVEEIEQVAEILSEKLGISLHEDESPPE
ncbi:MAG TPA: hypothetical protein GX693_02875 [Firmicutes bacterium]|nr:hypothetical protein [Bacillota bacterium]